jgi:N utilization substance protein B
MGRGKRSKAREAFMQMAFQMELQNDFSDEAMETFLEKYMQDVSRREYIGRCFAALKGNFGMIDAEIESCSDNWKISRMGKVDLSILRLAAAEMFFMDDIPVFVSVNEAVVLAKKFGSEDSFKFVNGVLGRMVRKNGLDVKQPGGGRDVRGG